MSTTRPSAPPGADGWVAAVHRSEDDFEPLGTAVVTEADRVLTCAHVVMAEEQVLEPLWVAFPTVSGSPRRRVSSVEKVYARPVKDVAVLVLEEPVPAGVEPAPLRCPDGKELVSRGWWAFGFPDRDPIGDSADGDIEKALSYGWVQLHTISRHLIRPGFSGGGLWSPDYGAVVGLVGQANADGDGRAITLHQADVDLPGLKLKELARWSAAAAGEDALAQWGWSLDRDPEGVRHWRPRARGVSIESERGWRFRGRTAALTAIASWLVRAAPDRRVLVVTGSPGVGKSAVLGRIVTTADAGIAAALPPDDAAVRARVGSVACAVHVKGKTALEVAEEIARAASAALPGDLDDLAPAVRSVLEQRNGERFNVIIDALDEAASPDQVRLIVARIVLPLAETCADVGTQVMVGTRRRDDGGDLLRSFGGALTVIDLDEPGYFAEEDLTAYALACLQLAGDERAGNPYNDTAIARPVAAQIAALAQRNFLIAGLIARAHGLHDDRAISPERLGFEPTVDAALSTYLQRLPSVGQLSTSQALTALAFADAPGLSAELWKVAIQALYGIRIAAEDLIRLSKSSVANFLVETSHDVTSDDRARNADTVYRLFHQALNDALLRDRAITSSREHDEQALTRAFTAQGRADNWQDVPDYLLRSLPAHAQAAGLIDDLLTDDLYLLYVDLRRLLPAADHAITPGGRRRARLLQLTPQAIAGSPNERIALFSVSEAIDDLGSDYRAEDWKAPYAAKWALIRPRAERTMLEGHRDSVLALCVIAVAGQPMLASGSSDHTVRIWDPLTGAQHAVLEGHPGDVYALCAVTVAGQAMLATGSRDGTVRIWEPNTGVQRAVLGGHRSWVRAVCAVTVAGQPMLASGSSDHSVRIWDPVTGALRAVLEGHQGEVSTVCAVTVAGEAMLASGGTDGTVRIWDPAAGVQRAVLEGHRSWVNSVCVITVAGQAMLASGSSDYSVRVWDPVTGVLRHVMRGQRSEINTVCAVTVAGQRLLAGGGGDGAVRIWDPVSGVQRAVLEGHQSSVRALCAVTVTGQQLLASSGNDDAVRIWHPAIGTQPSVVQSGEGPVNALCVVKAPGQRLLAGGGGDGAVRIWDLVTGVQRATLEGHDGQVNALCAITVAGQQLLASGSRDRTLRIWDPFTGVERAVLVGHPSWVIAVCAVVVAGQPMLASGGGDGAVRIWDPVTGAQRAVLEGHWKRVNAVCAVKVAGQPMLVSGSNDDTIRIWDPVTGVQRAVLEGHRGGVTALSAVTVAGQQMLASGGGDDMVRIWDPATGSERAVLEGHRGWVRATCRVTVAGQQLLASGSEDRTVRIWDPRAELCRVNMPIYHSGLAIAQTAGTLAIGLDTGVLAIGLRSIS